MKILSRRVNTSKSPEEIIYILQTSAYAGRKATFSESGFSIYCLKRRSFRYRTAVPVKGNIMEPENGVVLLEVQANLHCFLGIVMELIFALCSIYAVYIWLYFGMQGLGLLAISALGMLFSAQPFWDGIEILDCLETKLTQET